MRPHQRSSINATRAVLCTKRLVTRLALVLLVLLAPPALAQESTRDHFLRPPIPLSELDSIDQTLELSPDQKTAVKALIEGSVAAYEQKASAARALYAALEKAVQDKASDAHERSLAWRKAWGELIVTQNDAENTLLSDIKALLTPQQVADRWPAVLRKRHREVLRGIQAPSLTHWCKVDLVKILTDAPLSADERSAIKPLLAAYEVELDRPLAERKAFWDDKQHWTDEQRREEDKTLLNRNLEYGVRIAAINRRFAKQIIAMLSPAAAASVEASIHRTAYMQLYIDPRPAAELIPRLARLQGLEAAQHERIDQLAKAYARDFESLDKQGIAILEGFDAEVAKFSRQPIEVQERQMADEQYPGTLEFLAWTEKLNDLEARTVNSLRAILSKDQTNQLDAPAK